MKVLSFDPRTGLVGELQENGCIYYAGYKREDGESYGQVRHKGKIVGAHRVAFCNANGLDIEQIKDLLIMHSCNNPPCINPDCLDVGTYLDNNTYREEQDRAVYLPGEQNGQHKLTEGEVLAIRKDNRTLKQIANTYGVHLSTIHLIKTRKKWKHI